MLKICGRDAAVDYSITKEKYDALRQQQQGQGGKKPVSDDDDAMGSDRESEQDAEDAGGPGDGGGNKGSPPNLDSDSNSNEDDEEDDEEDDDDDEEEEEEGEEGGPDAGAGTGRAAPKRTSDVQHGCTVFVRNVAFDCGDVEVREKFAEFGEVRLALLVKDRATGMPRGTAFVKVRECRMREVEACDVCVKWWASHGWYLRLVWQAAQWCTSVTQTSSNRFLYCGVTREENTLIENGKIFREEHRHHHHGL